MESKDVRFAMKLRAFLPVQVLLTSVDFPSNPTKDVGTNEGYDLPRIGRHPSHALTVRTAQAAKANGKQQRLRTAVVFICWWRPPDRRAGLRTVVNGKRRDLGLGSIALVSLATKHEYCGKLLGRAEIRSPNIGSSGASGPRFRPPPQRCIPRTLRLSGMTNIASSGWLPSVRFLTASA